MMTRGGRLPVSVPRRLSSEEYFPEQQPLVRIYHQVVRELVKVHWHEFYELHIIVQGQGVHQLNGCERQIGPGTLFLLTPADFHALLPQQDCPLELFNIIFTEEVLGTELRHLLFREPGEDLHTQVDKEVRTLIESECSFLQQEAEQQRQGYHLAMRGSLERICLLLRRNAGTATFSLPPGGAETRPQPVHEALLYLQHHFREPLSLLDVASHVGLSSHYFSECFHRVTGQTFQYHLLDLRICFAQRLLSVSPLPISTICSTAGFTSLTHFERVFKRRFGVSPRAYQQRCMR